MNSWNIIKDHFSFPVYGPKTFGRSQQINNAADLFIKLIKNLTDADEATVLFNDDQEVTSAIPNRALENELREAGVIR